MSVSISLRLPTYIDLYLSLYRDWLTPYRVWSGIPVYNTAEEGYVNIYLSAYVYLYLLYLIYL